MNPEEASRVLAAAAAYDQRTVGPNQSKMWALALSGVTFDEAFDAVIRHFEQSTEYLLPAHITRLVVGERTRRAREAFATTVPAPNVDPADTAAWLTEQRALVAALAAGRVAAAEYEQSGMRLT